MIMYKYVDIWNKQMSRRAVYYSCVWKYWPSQNVDLMMALLKGNCVRFTHQSMYLWGTCCKAFCGSRGNRQSDKYPPSSSRLG